MDGIQEIGFTQSIPAANTYNPFFKRKGGLRVIFEL